VSRLAPLSRTAARTLLTTSRVAAALDTAGLDSDRLVATITAVGHLIFDHPEIVTLDLNPVIVSDGGCALTDATVSIHPLDEPDLPIRRLD
jgi:hypothetical protein